MDETLINSNQTESSSWKDNVISPKIKASIKNNMATHSPRRRPAMECVKETAQALAMDTVQHVSGLRISCLINSPHKRTMRRIVDELRSRHEIMFNSMVASLELSKDSNFEDTFRSVSDEMLSDNRYNWGRVVAVYAFGGRLAKHYAENNMNGYVDRIGEYLGKYVCEKLAWWIHKQGGWDSFDEYFPDLRSFEDKVWKGLLVTAAFGLGALATMVAVR